MGDLDKSVHRRERDPYENIVTGRIERDKKAQDEGYADARKAAKSQIFAALVSYFKKVLSSLSTEGKEKGAFLLDEGPLIDSILAFRNVLKILSIEDRSHHPEFAQQMSELWHKLVDDCNSIQGQTGVSIEGLAKIKFFISQVMHYPPGEDHTLGYYFDEFAGKTWIPFPFMDMLKELHEEHLTNPATSTLSNWLSLLNEMLATR